PPPPPPTPPPLRGVGGASLLVSPPPFVEEGPGVGGTHVACRTTSGRPWCRKGLSRSATSCCWKNNCSRPVASNRQITVASPSSLAQKARSACQFASGTASTMRSWASEIQISVYDNPSYFSGA